MRIAFAGNPNSGKTTMYNALTGRNEKVGNWAGVTVDKKEAAIKKAYAGDVALTAVDLPGAYSMSPFTSEESVTSTYVRNENPDAIINIVDATNLSRSLFFTTQLLELGIPVVVALNKADLNEKKETVINAKLLSQKLGCPVVETISTDRKHKDLGLVVKAAKEQMGKTQKAPYDQGDVDMTDKKAVEEADRKRFAFVNAIVKEVETRKVYTKDKNVQDKIDAVLTHPLAGLPIFAVVMYLVFQISQAWLGNWIANGVEVAGYTIPGLSTLIDAFGAWISGFMDGVNPLLASLLIDGIIGGFSAVVGFLPLVMVMYFLIALLEDCGYMARATVVLDPIFKKVGLSGKSVIPFVIGTGCAIPGVMACRTIRNERERRATAMLAPFMPCGAKLPVIALFVGAFFPSHGWIGTMMYFAGILIILLCALLINKLTGYKARKSFFIMELPEYKLPSLKRATTSMLQRGWSYVVKAGTIILLCNFVVHVLQSFTWGFQFIDYSAIEAEFAANAEVIAASFQGFDLASVEALIKAVAMSDPAEALTFIESAAQELENPALLDAFRNADLQTIANLEAQLAANNDALRVEMTAAADTSILKTIATPFGYILWPVVGAAIWQLAAAAVTGFIAKENVVGTVAICYGITNLIGTESLEMAEGAGTAVAGIIGITPVAALAFLMFNLFTPPCFAAIGAMNSEIKSKKWLFGGIGLQLGVGFTIGYVVYTIGTLLTAPESLDVIPAICGGVAVAAMAAFVMFLIGKTNKTMQKEYALSGKR